MKTITSIPKMQEFARQLRLGGLEVGFVPTMGYLHEGHLDLVRCARETCDVVVVSIFVNPTQFNDPSDFEKYPRDDARDARLLEAAGVDVLFMPHADDVYLPNAATTVSVTGLTDTLCGPGRPGHFEGVATIVTSLFNMVTPDKAFFGEKDYQQLQVISRMARDLHMPLEIVPVPTFREVDGLAMSSRNARLDEASREMAPTIFEALVAACDAFAAGETDGAALIERARSVLARYSEIEVEYLEIVDGETLSPAARADDRSVMALAAFLGGVRLIDNTFLARAPRVPEIEGDRSDPIPDVIEYGSH